MDWKLETVKLSEILKGGPITAALRATQKEGFTLSVAGDITLEISADKIRNAQTDSVTHYKAGRIWRIDAAESYKGAGILYHFLQYAGEGKFITQQQVRDEKGKTQVISTNYSLKNGELYEVPAVARSNRKWTDKIKTPSHNHVTTVSEKHNAPLTLA